MSELLQREGMGTILAILAADGAVLLEGIRTRDLGGSASTIEFTDAICRRRPSSS